MVNAVFHLSLSKRFTKIQRNFSVPSRFHHCWGHKLFLILIGQDP